MITTGRCRRPKIRLSLAATAAVLSLLATAAAAAPTPTAGAAAPAGAHFYRIQIPSPFARQSTLSQTIADDVGRAELPGRTPFNSGADAYTVAGKAALYVSWIAATATSAHPAAAARWALDALRTSPATAAAISDPTTDVTWHEGVRANVAEGTLTWQQPSDQTTTYARVLAFTSPAHELRVVKAECVVDDHDVAAMRPACKKALASLAIAAKRSPLGSLPAARNGAPAIAAEGTIPSGAPPGGGAARGPGGAAPAVAIGGDGGIPVPTITPAGNVVYSPARSSGTSYRWILIAGIALVAAAFLWTAWARRDSGRDGGRR